MALVLGENSYITVEDATAYFETRIDSGAWFAADLDDKESSLITATLILDENQFIGVAVSSTQSLAWPRSGASYYDPKYGTYIEIATNEIPRRVELATLELAYQLLANENLLDGKTQTFEEISIGSITIKDSNNDVTRTPVTPKLAKDFIKPLLIPAASSRSWWRAN